MKKNFFEAEPEQITMSELIKVRKDEMQGILPNHFTKVGDVVVYGKTIEIGGTKR